MENKEIYFDRVLQQVKITLPNSSRGQLIGWPRKVSNH